LYGVHARLKTCEGRAAEGASNLVQFCSVVRTRLPYANLLVDKMILLAAAGVCQNAAYGCARTPQATPESLRILCQGFPPLATSNLLRSAFVGEYCSFADFTSAFRTNRMLFGVDKAGNAVRVLHRLISPFILNPHATVRMYYEPINPAIQGISVSPMVAVPFNEHEFDQQSGFHIKNPAGWYLFAIAAPNFEECVKRANKHKVRSDLLAIYLAGRTGTQCDIKDYFTGRDYLVDEKTGLPFCPGPDGKPGTDDDVRLW